MPEISRRSLLTVLVVLAAGCTPKRPAPADMVATADALDKEFATAFNKGDVAAVMATFWNSPDFFSIGLDGMGVQGWAAAKDAMVQTLAGMKGATIVFVDPRNIPLGDVVLGVGKIRISIPADSGRSEEMVVRYTDIKALRDGKWVVVHDHASAPMPPTPTVPASK